MARKDWVDKLIKPEQDNWFEKSLKRAKQNESKATGVSSDGYVDPSTIFINRGSLRFPSRCSRSENGHMWNFYNTIRKIVDNKSESGTHAKQAAAIFVAIKSLHGGINDKTEIFCSSELTSGIKSRDRWPSRDHRMTLFLNPDNVDDFVEKLETAQREQEFFRRSETRYRPVPEPPLDMPQNHLPPDSQPLSKKQEIDAAQSVLQYNVFELTSKVDDAYYGNRHEHRKPPDRSR